MQKDVFAATEGNAWYHRNREHLRADSMEFEWLNSQLLPFAEHINSILEIGCCSGIKVNSLSTSLSARGYGIDPSAEAIAEGNAAGHGELRVGTADMLDYPDAHFDLVYFAFCLYLVDRKSLRKCIAEADRVLRPGGFLAITDFDPLHPHCRAYCHKDGVFSYKENHAAYFLTNKQYALCAKQSYSQQQRYFNFDENERVATWVLYKEPTPYPRRNFS